MSEFTLAEWIAAKRELYDLNAEYAAQVQPLVDQFTEKCKAAGIPFRLHFVPSQTEEGAENLVELYTFNASRAVPEILACTILNELSAESYEVLCQFYELCVNKYGPNRVAPNPDLAEYEGDEFTMENWFNTVPAHFDAMEKYRAEIEPIAASIKELCAKLNLPMRGMAVAKYEDETAYMHNIGVLGGPERATPEMVALAQMSKFDYNTVKGVGVVLEAAREKYDDTESRIKAALSKLFSPE